MTTYVLSSGYKGADTAHRELRPDVPACSAYTTGRWQRIQLRHARLLNLNPCRERRCFPRGFAEGDES